MSTLSDPLAQLDPHRITVRISALSEELRLLRRLRLLAVRARERHHDQEQHHEHDRVRDRGPA